MKTETAPKHSSKESWIKSLFSGKSEEKSTADDSQSEITLIQRLDQNIDSKPKKGSKIPPNFNAADMCFGSCCRK